MTQQLIHSETYGDKSLRQYNIGWETIMIYPTLTPDMPLSEKAHTVNTNKNALENIHLPTKVMLRSLGDTLECSPVVTFIAAEFERVTYSQLRTNIEVSATSYHSANGYLIKDNIDAGNDNALKTVNDHMEDVTKIRSDGIYYAKLYSNINFESVDPAHTTNYKFNWYHLLPVKAKTVVVSKAGDDPKTTHQLHSTFVGQSDWTTSKTSKNNNENWEHPNAIPDPFDLVESTIKDKNCDNQINITSEKGRLDKIIYITAADTIKREIFKSLCPNYIDNPATAILKIKQIDPDSVDPSKKVTSSV